MAKRERVLSYFFRFVMVICVLYPMIGCKPSGAEIAGIKEAIKDFVEKDGLMRPNSQSLESVTLDRLDRINIEGKSDLNFEIVSNKLPGGPGGRVLEEWKEKAWVARVRLSGAFKSDQTKFDLEFKFFAYKDESGRWIAKLDPRSVKSK
jgi:hypothetical protein